MGKERTRSWQSKFDLPQCSLFPVIVHVITVPWDDSSGEHMVHSTDDNYAVAHARHDVLLPWTWCAV